MLEIIKRSISNVSDTEFSLHYMKYVFDVQDSNISKELRSALGNVQTSDKVSQQLNLELERLIAIC